MQFIRGMAVKKRRSLATIAGDLQKLLHKMLEEKLFLSEGLTKAKHLHESKRRALNVSEDSLFALAWDIPNWWGKNEAIQITISGILHISGSSTERGSIQADMANLKKEIEPYIKGLNTKKRQAASHLLLFMISDELRRFKPYDVPVLAVKYKSITDAKLRELKEELRIATIDCGMTTVGKNLL